MLKHLEQLGMIEMDGLEQAFRELLKAQERLAMQAVIAAYKARLLAKSAGLETWLNQQKADMKQFANNTLPAELESGFEGAAATSAKTYLANIGEPDLKSPIKKG